MRISHLQSITKLVEDLLFKIEIAEGKKRTLDQWTNVVFVVGSVECVQEGCED